MHVSPASAQLQDILASGMLADNVRKTGERLLRRLSSPVRVALLGPDGSGKDELHDMLLARPVEGTTISIVPADCETPFGEADICLWCTTAFDEAEQMLWQQAPDVLKDHSFLVPLATPDAAPSLFAEERLDALGEIVAEEFHSMFPIILGPRESAPSETLDALLSEITNLVRTGQAADRDNAEYFVRNYQAVVAPAPDIAARESAGKNQEAPAPPEVAQPSSSQPKADAPPTDVYQRALDHICSRAGDLTEPRSADDTDEINRILSICQETSEVVAEILSEARSDNPDFLLLKEDVLCAADKLLLMSVEGGIAPAVAAVTTLLQTRREMQARIAA